MLHVYVHIQARKIVQQALAQAEVNSSGDAGGVDGDDSPDHGGGRARHHAHPDYPGCGGGGADERLLRRAG
jgi:hypothetical protein